MATLSDSDADDADEFDVEQFDLEEECEVDEGGRAGEGGGGRGVASLAAAGNANVDLRMERLPPGQVYGSTPLPLATAPRQSTGQVHC